MTCTECESEAECDGVFPVASPSPRGSSLASTGSDTLKCDIDDNVLLGGGKGTTRAPSASGNEGTIPLPDPSEAVPSRVIPNP